MTRITTKTKGLLVLTTTTTTTATPTTTATARTAAHTEISEVVWKIATAGGIMETTPVSTRSYTKLSGGRIGISIKICNDQKRRLETNAFGSADTSCDFQHEQLQARGPSVIA